MSNLNPILEDFQKQLEVITQEFKEELRKLRTGIATPALVEDILIDYYGSKVTLKQIAAISCPEPRQILIQPWDKNSIEAIEKALTQADLGALPTVDGQNIRINLPPLTEEFRQKLVTQVSQKKEEFRQRIRRIRDEILREIQKMYEEKNISEDEKFQLKEKVDEITKEFNKKLDEIEEVKRKEILEI